MARSPSPLTKAALARFDAACAACNAITGQDLIDEGYGPDDMGGKEFGALLRQRRVEFMRDVEDEL